MSQKLQHTLLIFIFSLIFISAAAQQKIKVSGIITDAQTGNPILYANVMFQELGIGTSSNEKGEFIFHSVLEGTYTFVVTYIGYKNASFKIKLKKDVNLKIELHKQSLGLKGVTVTAVNSTGGVTSSIVSSEAISHIQASSLKDIMQLIPGNISENPNLSKPGQITIREITENANSALGTAIIIDNIPVSNDGNLQKSINNYNVFSSVAGTGVDLRQISVENIESIIVDVGIPSAEHGNLTSGAVHIKTKSGGSPYNVKLQVNPHTKQIYLGKGYLLHNNNGVININLGFTNSFHDLTKQTKQYKRINATTKYSRTFFRDKSPLIVDVKFNYLQSLDNYKYDLDMLKEEANFAQDHSLRGKITAMWSLNKSFLKSVAFDFGYSKTWQIGFERKLERSIFGPNFFATATTNGEYEISYTPATFYSEVTYDGKPFNLYSKIKTRFYHKTNFFSNNILIGTEWRTTGNNGKGRIFDLQKPPTAIAARPRPFTNIPSLNQFSLFLEDKITLNIGTTTLNVMAGIRMDNIQPNGFFKTSGSINFDPRINLNYQIPSKRNNSLFKNISLRIGYGQTTKAPTLTHLYPDKKYNDKINFNYYPNLIVATTNIVQNTKNYNLQPAKSNKYETGIDFEISKTKVRITGFYEKHEGGFALNQIYYPMEFRDYDILEAGKNPYYIEGNGIYFNDKQTGEPIALGYKNNKEFVSYSQFENASTRIKRGIEYSFSFGKIDALRTSFLINGAWLQTELYQTNAPFWKTIGYTIFNKNTSRQELFAVKYKNRFGFGVENERLNTNFNIITHIPEIKILVTLTTQVIWFEKNHRTIYNNNKLYSLTELRNYLNQPNLFKSDKEENFYYYLPVSYKNYNNNEHNYEPSDFENRIAQQAIKKWRKYLFPVSTLPPIFVCHLKISKEISKRIRLSFYANNFLNIRPWFLDVRNGKYIRRNQQPYFGADIKMQF
jgi:hypothetical protein